MHSQFRQFVKITTTLENVRKEQNSNLQISQTSFSHYQVNCFQSIEIAFRQVINKNLWDQKSDTCQQNSSVKINGGRIRSLVLTSIWIQSSTFPLSQWFCPRSDRMKKSSEPSKYSDQETEIKALTTKLRQDFPFTFRIRFNIIASVRSCKKLLRFKLCLLYTEIFSKRRKIYS